MFIIEDIGGQNTPVFKPFFADGEGTDLVKGALVEAPDVSEPNKLGAITKIGAVTAPIDVVGVLSSLLDVSVDGEWEYDSGDLLTDATKSPERDVDIRPLGVVHSQLLESNDQEVYNDSDDTTVDLTTTIAFGAADLIGGGFLYDDATEQLRFIEDQDGANSITLNSATTTAITNAQNRKTVLIPPRLYGAGANQGMQVSATYDTINIDGDETALWAKVVDVYIQAAKGVGLERLNPRKHDVATVLAAKFYVDIIIADHVFNVGD